MLKLMGKKIFTILRSKILFIKPVISFQEKSHTFVRGKAVRGGLRDQMS